MRWNDEATLIQGVGWERSQCFRNPSRLTYTCMHWDGRLILLLHNGDQFVSGLTDTVLQDMLYSFVLCGFLRQSLSLLVRADCFVSMNIYLFLYLFLRAYSLVDSSRLSTFVISILLIIYGSFRLVVFKLFLLFVSCVLIHCSNAPISSRKKQDWCLVKWLTFAKKACFFRFIVVNPMLFELWNE